LTAQFSSSDHGARVYGWHIPMDSYEIPILFYRPALWSKGQRFDLLGSQMDWRRHCSTPEFQLHQQVLRPSLFKVLPDESFALLSHNRDVAVLRDNKLLS
jgi:hypothetical protein